MIDLDKEIELYKAKAAFYKSRKIQEYYDTARELEFVVETLEKLRSERPQGEWINLGINNENRTFYKCSKCGFVVLDFPETVNTTYPFCTCGADMRKGVIQNESSS